MAARVSFRDPSGLCIRLDGRILRLVRQEAVEPFEAFLAGPAGRDAVKQGWVVETRRLAAPEERVLRERLAVVQPGVTVGDGDVFYEHACVPFVSYPSEWPPEMLHAAAGLTLDLSCRLLEEGLGLKDATPYNILFKGPDPVWVDLLSVEKRTTGDPLWLPYAQFCRTFLFPLLMWRYWELDSAGFALLYRDGIEPEAFYRLCGWGRRLRPPVLQHVSIPVWFGRRAGSETVSRPNLLRDAERAQFVVASLFASLWGAIGTACHSDRAPSAWIDYMGTHSYSESGFAAKEGLVRDFLGFIQPRSLLDVGANTGHFSLLAARLGARVVAIDYDAGCMGRLWRQARATRANVLPLVVNLARPTPAVGWRNGECGSFLERAAGAFDTVLMLAVVHHLLVTERVPFVELAELVDTLTTAWAVIEYVPPEDPMFKRIVRGREHLHGGMTPALFEAAFESRFTVQRREPIPDSGRILYLLKKKDGR
ncbi:MAG: class I SAM-dependent methyltransferase [Kiritimatiellia bacterium]